MTVQELREQLRSKGLPVGGIKKELLARLRAFAGASTEELEAQKLNSSGRGKRRANNNAVGDEDAEGCKQQ
jgi:hypothetical protein